MKRITTEILVIGGGATGAGVVQDVALRGFRAVLVEKRDLTHGTTGRYHGLLHSGGRYVVKDPKAAGECIEENRILRRIMPHCLEDTGGFFVTTPWDDPAYADSFLENCAKAGVPCEEIPLTVMRREEPRLNPHISRCFRVPDAAADSFLATQCVAESARQHGAEILTYHEVRRLLQEGDKVVGAVCYDLVKDEEVTITADIVVNAAGAWAGKIAQTIGVEINVLAGKGTMIAANYRLVNTVINRCKMPDDGDILVPIQTVAVIGTTDERVADPEQFAIEPWEIDLMLEEGEKLIPGFKQLRMLRAWAGVRPLYQDSIPAETRAESRDVTRAYTLLDHQERDGLSGFITITGGKWTTYRQMAEVTADRVCQKLNSERPCTTHLQPLPSLFAPKQRTSAGYHYLGARLQRTEESQEYGALICECEMATQADVEQAINSGQSKTIDDIRRDVRLGMGPCQGGFCTLRVTGMVHAHMIQADMVHKMGETAVTDANVALRDFLRERWKGIRPVLWGDQLKQERLDELIYLSLLNADNLPGEKQSRLGPVMYSEEEASGM